MMIYLVFLLLLCFQGCQQKQQEEEIIHMTVLRGPSIIALADWLENPPVIGGKRVCLTLADSPDWVQAALIKQEADLAVLPMVSAANLYNKGISMRLAGCPIWGTLYAVEKQPDEQAALYLFGQGTTPDLLTRYYLHRQGGRYPLNYAYNTPAEIIQALRANRVHRAVLSEPFLSMALQRDTALHIVADLNRFTDQDSIGFAQTAIVYAPSLEKHREALDSLLTLACDYTNQHPREAIDILETHRVFAPGSLTPSTIRRCRIDYRTAREAEAAIYDFLRLIEQYEPKAIGGRLPDRRFITPCP